MRQLPAQSDATPAIAEDVIQTATARRAGRTALLFGVAAMPGTSPPDVPADVIRIIGIPPSGRERVGGAPLTLFRAPGYTLAVGDGGPRRAVVAIAARPGEARALGRAVARGLDQCPDTRPDRAPGRRRAPGRDCAPRAW